MLETSIIPVTDVYKPSLHHSHIEHLLWYTYLRQRSVPGFCVTMKEVCAPKCKTSCDVNFAPSLNKHCKSMAKCLNQNQKRYQCSCYQNETMHRTVFFSTYIFITQLTYLVTLFQHVGPVEQPSLAKRTTGRSIVNNIDFFSI